MNKDIGPKAIRVDIIVLGKVSRFLLSVSFLPLVAGCTSMTAGETSPAPQTGNAQIMPLGSANATSSSPSIGSATTAQGTTAPVVQGVCPQIFMKDADAVYRIYAKGAQDDPKNLVLQASLGDMTRQCTLNGSNLAMTVVAQGRVIAGPAGGASAVTLPIRVSVVDGDTVLYSEVTNVQAQIPPGQGNAQFLFRKDGVTLPAGAGPLVRVHIGFDKAPPAKAGKKKKKQSDF